MVEFAFSRRVLSVGTTMYAEMKRIFDFPHKEGRYVVDGVVYCNTISEGGGSRFTLWRKGDEYGPARDMKDRPDRKAGVYTAAKPHAKDHGKHDCSHEMSHAVPLPQLGLCFGYKEGGHITGFVYLNSLGFHYGQGFVWMVSPGSGIMQALPQEFSKSLHPNINRFWQLFEQGKLVEMTERFAKVPFVLDEREGVACRMDGRYFVSHSAHKEVLADPAAWFEKNGRYARSSAEALGRNVLSLRAKA